MTSDSENFDNLMNEISKTDAYAQLLANIKTKMDERDLKLITMTVSKCRLYCDVHNMPTEFGVMDPQSIIDEVDNVNKK